MRKSLAILVVAISGCAAEPPRPHSQEAPLAQTPSFIGLLHTSERPAREGAALRFGEISELKGCPYDPAVTAIPAGGGLLVRISAPVPTELGLELDTSQGPRRVVAPRDLDDEARLAATGRAYFYENDALARSAATGTIAPREVALWTARSNDRRFDLLIWDRSFAPQASGDDLQSPPLRVSLVGTCPDLSLVLEQTETSLRPGQIRRIHARAVPSGDGVRTMSIALSVTGMPKGVTIAQRDPLLASADWSNPRATTFDIAIGPEAVPSVVKLELVARLGAIERRAPFLLTILPKDDY